MKIFKKNCITNIFGTEPVGTSEVAVRRGGRLITLSVFLMNFLNYISNYVVEGKRVACKIICAHSLF